MPVFKNHMILINPEDYTLGAVYFENDNFNFQIYQNLIKQKIEDLIDFYVAERLNTAAYGFKISEQDVLDDLANTIHDKLNIAVYGGDAMSLTESIMQSGSFGSFITKMKYGFDEYENMIGAMPMPVPLSSGESETLYYNENKVAEIIDNTNIIEYIETLQTYGITELL